MFQIKNFRSIVASMINVAAAQQSAVTDFSVGSVGRTLMESPAAEIEELYLQMLLGLQDAIPVSIYQAFDFQIVDAAAASGLVSLSFPEPLTENRLIPKGSVFEAPSSGATFYSLADVVALAGSTVAVVTVMAAVPGVAGNIAADTITQASGAASLPTGTTFDHLAFTSGRDSESDVERKTRFVQFVLSLARGTVQAVRYAASTATVLDGLGRVQEYVTRVGLDEVPGHVGVYLYGSTGAPSPALIEAAQRIIDGYVDDGTGAKVSGYRSAGVEVAVSAMVERAVNIAVSVATLPGALQTVALSNLVIAAVEGAVSAIGSGDVLRSDAIVGAVLAVPGVLACYVANDSNIICGQFEVLMPGAITVTWIPNA